jgi:hypothetical protein
MKAYNYKLQLAGTTLMRHVDAKRHYFIKYRAYAYDESELLKYTGQYNRLRITTSKGNIYEISAADFHAKSYLNADYGKLQRLVNVCDLELVAQRQKAVHLPMHLYEELKAESLRTGRPMTTLIEVKRSA